MKDLGTTLLIAALALYAIHTLGHKKSQDNDAVDIEKIEINAEHVTIDEGLFEVEFDDLEND